MKKLWLLLSLLLLTGCQDRQPTEMPDVGPEPAVETAVAEKKAGEEAENPVFLLADADGVTVGEISWNMVCSEPELTECLEILAVQANPEGASFFGPMAQTDDQYSFYCYTAIAPDGEDLALSVACRADESVVSAHCPGDQKPYLLLETPEGQVLQLPNGEQRIPTAELWDGEAQWLVGSADGLLALSTDGQAAAFDLEGRLLWTEDFSGTVETAFVTASNEIRVLTRWESLPMLQEVDLASGRLTSVGAVPEALCQCRLYPGDRWGYDLLALDGKAIFGWRAGENTVYRLCILSDVSLEADQVKGLACLDQDTLLVLSQEDEMLARRLLRTSMTELDLEEELRLLPLIEAAAYDKTSAVVMEEPWLGCEMEVPAEYQGDLMSHTDWEHELFGFYDGETRARSPEDLGGNGWCWSVLAFAQEDYVSRYHQSFNTWAEGNLNPTDRQLGRDENYVYILSTPEEARYYLNDDVSRESYYRHCLHGYAMLTDFLARNDITPSPDWEAFYLDLVWSLYETEFAAAAQIREIGASEVVPQLTAPDTLEGLVLLDTWSAEGLEVDYLAIASPYQYLGKRIFYCYPGEDQYMDGSYYQYAGGEITEIQPEQIHSLFQETPQGQVHIRWILTDSGLAAHSIPAVRIGQEAAQELEASPILVPGRTDGMYLIWGNGYGDISAAWLNLEASTVTPLELGTDLPVTAIRWNEDGSRALLRLEDRTYAFWDGNTTRSLGEITGTPATISEPSWMSREKFCYIVQEADGTDQALQQYNCESGTVSTLLDNFRNYSGILEETPSYILLFPSYALRMTAGEAVRLLNLETGRQWKLEGQPSGYFSPGTADNALFTAWAGPDRAAFGLLDARTATFTWFKRQPRVNQTEEFDPLLLDRHTVLIPTEQPEAPGPAYLYAYRFTDQES